MANEMRDRLVELMLDAPQMPCVKNGRATGKRFQTFQNIADHLIENGMVVPSCYIGQEIWYIRKHYDGSNELAKGKISMLQQKADKSWKFRITINSSSWDFKTEDIGERYFLTKSEAEQKLKEMRGENDL
jgi:hypothetical protein